MKSSLRRHSNTKPGGARSSEHKERGSHLFRSSLLTVNSVGSCNRARAVQGREAGSRQAHQASPGRLEALWRAGQGAHARGAEQAMPPGLTLDRVGKLGARKRLGRCNARQCRAPVAFGAENVPTQVKGGIARVPWLAGMVGMICQD